MDQGHLERQNIHIYKTNLYYEHFKLSIRVVRGKTRNK